MNDTLNIPISSTKDAIELGLSSLVECPRCLKTYTEDEYENRGWIREFNECLSCDHLHNEEIEA